MNSECCENCKFNAGDVCLGYGTLPSDDDTLDICTYSQEIAVLSSFLGGEACDYYANEKE